MGRSGKAYKALFGALAFVGFIWLLFVGTLETGGTNTTTTKVYPRPAAGRFKHMEMEGREKVGREKLGVHPDKSDLNYMSKRRVPNGPDPIHNRRTGNSVQPPGLA